MSVRAGLLLATVVAATAASAAPRHSVPSGSPAALQKVFDCRAITEAQARLACYDANVGELSEAQTRGDVAVVDREQVKQTKRSLFGFNLPTLNLFGGKSGDARKDARDDEVQEITGTVAKVGHTGDGAWIVVLEDGARWEQTDAVILGRAPKPGSTAVIKRGALGSFKMSIDNGPGMKARRTG